MSENDKAEDEPVDSEGSVESTEAESEKETPRKPRRRGLRSNKAKILVVVAIISIALAIVLWGAAPPEYITVEELMEDSDSYEGKDVTVRGKVGNWTGGQNFTMVDHRNASLEIQVTHENPIPEGFAEEKEVVVEGRLERDATSLTLVTTEIQVGCPSKY